MKLKENDARGLWNFYAEALELDSTYVDAYYKKNPQKRGFFLKATHPANDQIEEGEISDFSLCHINTGLIMQDAYFQRV